MTPRERAIEMLRQEPTPTRAAVARQLGVPPSTVKYWADVAGIPPGSRGRPPKHGERATHRIQLRVPPSMYETAVERMAATGIDNLAELIEGLADGTLRISRT